MTAATRARTGRERRSRLGLDEALIALFIGAMEANDHVSPREAARAHHLIWSTRRFRRKSGEAVGRLIDRMRTLLADQGTAPVMERAARAVTRGLRPAAFAVVTDLLLADGRMDARERRFLRRLGADLQIEPAAMRRITEVMLIKNRL